jgi:hypothetical protein
MRPFLVLGAFAGALALACTSSTEPQPETFSATLTTAAEVPPVTNAPNASGSAAFTLRPRAGRTMDFTIDVTGLSGPAIGAHIHGPAGPGVNAGIIVSFDAQLTANITTGRLAAGSFTSANAMAAGVSQEARFDSVLVLMRNGNAYVNVHTALNPGGEIRGQIQQP